MDVHGITFHLCQGATGMTEEQRYEDIFTTLLMSGEYREQDIDAQVHEIMDNPHIYPEYFN
tara:strand:+ start:782 stop:964 length:183 start_codon:yes stop_codon:yes gene_type:complete